MILPKLGIHGYHKIQEQAILAGVFSGEPVLLIGPPGTAKTELVGAIGAALREDSKKLNPDGSNLFNYQIYDASKINFEDLFGLPSIKALQENPPRVEYISTPSSIWNKHMIAFDELNRCAEDRQANLFEIIRSRKLHGVPTGNMCIFGTMNPFGDTGTIEMSDPLVDRFMLFVKIDGFSNIPSAHRKKIISRVGDKEGVGFQYWGGEKSEFSVEEDIKGGKVSHNTNLAAVGEEIRNLFLSASKYKKQLNDSLTPAIVEVIDKLVDSMKTEFSKEALGVQTETTISGRRASSTCRAILAVRAVQLAMRGPEEELEDIVSTIINTIKLSLPIGIGGKLEKDILDRANKVVENTVKTVWPTIKAGKSTVDIDIINEVLSSRNPIRILDGLLTVNMNDITKKTVFGHLLDRDRYAGKDGTITPEAQDNFDRIKVLVFKLGETIPDFIPKHVNLDITPDIIEKVSKKAQHSSSDPVAVEIQPFIMAFLEEYKDNKPVYFAAKTTILYYWSNISTEPDAIEALVAMNRTAKNIEKKMKYHANNKATSGQNPIT